MELVSITIHENARGDKVIVDIIKEIIKLLHVETDNFKHGWRIDDTHGDRWLVGIIPEPIAIQLQVLYDAQIALRKKSYNEGLAEGLNAINSLNRGEISMGNFNRQQDRARNNK